MSKINASQFEYLQKCAYACHGNQLYGTQPYSVHLQDCDAIAVKYGFENDFELRTAVLCHDLVEDTTVKLVDILFLTNSGFVTHMVECVTDEPRLPGETRKQQKHKTYPKILRGGKYAILVKLIDRLANVRRGAKNNMYRDEWPDMYNALVLSEYFPECTTSSSNHLSNAIQDILKEIHSILFGM